MPEPAAPCGDRPDVRAAAAELDGRIRAALEQLTPKLRAAIVLTVLQDFSLPDQPGNLCSRQAQGIGHLANAQAFDFLQMTNLIH